MIILGVTGGIGSGKTTVCNVFASKGIPVYNSDERAKEILMHHPEVKKQLLRLFGQGVFTDQLPDRKKIASIVFSDKEKLKLLNAIIHPKVKEDFEQWKKEQTSKLIIKEAAILIESGAYKQVDQIVVITAPVEQRIKRVMQRDGVSRQEILKRLSNQFDDNTRLKYAHFVIDNSEGKNLDRQVDEVLKRLLF
ncbi:MAG: dephospho-CoA kinase [Bacteroidia bacterium]